ncbi:hypothetical protein HKBW3S06_01364, partial [Candidatus Hakubella thermalkaliphila]
ILTLPQVPAILTVCRTYVRLSRAGLCSKIEKIKEQKSEVNEVHEGTFD